MVDLLGNEIPTERRSESAIQSAVVELLRQAGWFVVRINGMGMKKRGRWLFSYHIFGHGHKDFPDLVALKASRCRCGQLHVRMVLVETKAEQGRLSPGQKRLHRVLELLGIAVVVPRSVEEVREVIDG